MDNASGVSIFARTTDWLFARSGNFFSRQHETMLCMLSQCLSTVESSRCPNPFHALCLRRFGTIASSPTGRTNARNSSKRTRLVSVLRVSSSDSIFEAGLYMPLAATPVRSCLLFLAVWCACRDLLRWRLLCFNLWHHCKYFNFVRFGTMNFRKMGCVFSGVLTYHAVLRCE